MGKCIALMTLTLSLVANAAPVPVTCSSDSSQTYCSSTAPAGKVQISSVGSSTSKPRSTIKVTAIGSDQINVASTANTKSMQANLIVNSAQYVNSVTLDVGAKWDSGLPSYGLSSADNAGTGIVVAGLVTNLNINVSGYVGKSGDNADVVCAKKIMAGDFGATIKSNFEARRSGNPALSLTRCDSVDVQSLNEDAEVDFCPAGFNYLSGQDNATEPTESVRRWREKMECSRNNVIERRVCTYTTLGETQTYNNDSLGNVVIPSCIGYFTTKYSSNPPSPSEVTSVDTIVTKYYYAYSCPANFSFIRYTRDYRNVTTPIPDQSTDAPFISCTPSSCGGIQANSDTANFTKATVSLASGESGSAGGAVKAFLYDAKNISVAYANGQHGQNAIQNLAVTPAKKYCSQKINTTQEEWIDPFVFFRTVIYQPISFNPPPTINTSIIPTRQYVESENIFTDVDESVREYISAHICQGGC